MLQSEISIFPQPTIPAIDDFNAETAQLQMAGQLSQVAERLADHEAQSSSQEAQTEYRPVLIYDEAGTLGGELSSDLNQAIKDLESHGYHVVIVTSNNPDRLLTIDLFYKILAEQGYGSAADGTLDPYVIGCITNYNAIDVPGETGRVECLAGANVPFSVAQDEEAAGYIVQQARSNLQGGYTNAYNYYDREATAYEQAIEQANQPVETEQTEVQPLTGLETAPSQPERVNYIEKYQQEIRIGSGVVVALVMAGLWARYGEPRRKYKNQTRNIKKNVETRFQELDMVMATGGGLTIFDALASDLEASYPEQAQEVREQRAAFLAVWEEAQNLATVSRDTKVSFFDKETQAALRKKLAQLEVHIRDMYTKIGEKKVEHEDITERKRAAGANLETASTEFAATEEWYTTQRQAKGNVLPQTEKALAGIKSKYDAAEQNIRYGGQDLLGSDIAREVVALLEKFKSAVGVFIAAYDVSQRLLDDSAKQLQPWADKVIMPNDLAHAGVVELTHASAGIGNDTEFTDVVTHAEAARGHFESAKLFATSISETLRQDDANGVALQAIFDRQFTNQVTGIQQEFAKALSKANTLAGEGEWRRASQELGVMLVKSNEALAEMKRLEALHQTNIDDLKRLSIDVASAQKRFDVEATKLWGELQADFVPDNYVGFTTHHTQAGQILRDLYDHPDNDQDVASNAARENDMEHQHFDKAAEIIGGMERQLAKSHQLMDELRERHTLANKAKSEYKVAIGNSAKRIADAVASIDTKEEDRLVDTTVDTKIKSAKELQTQAEKAAEKLVYVTAFELANQASQLAIEARQSAEEQITRLKELFARMDRQKADSKQRLETVHSEIDREADAVVSRRTYDAITAAKALFLSIQTNEKGLATKEDHQLAAGVQQTTSEYEKTMQNASQAMQSLEQDRREHQAALNQAKQAISSASSEINSARSVCSDHRSGSYGDSELASAVSTLPSEPPWGSTKATIDSALQKAKQAESYAEAAARKAQAEINAYEHREMLKRQAEQAARDKALKEAREAAERVQKAAEAARKATHGGGGFNSGPTHGGKGFK